MKGGDFLSGSPEDTFNLGMRLARELDDGDIVALHGDLGSGKTVMVQGICAGLDVTERVTSPTFTLVHEYNGRMPVYHLDFYRLESESEVEGLDLDYYTARGGVLLVEWAERAGTLLGAVRLRIYIEIVPSNDQARRIRVSGEDPGVQT